MNLEEIKQKMFEKLKASGWDRFFKSFIFSSEFDLILNQLWNQTKIDKRFTPPLKQVFTAFEECPHDKLKIVIITSDPYPQLGMADGIAFSCGNTEKPQASLRYILDEINRTVYNGHSVSQDINLKRWSNQGILLLNMALTTEVGKIGGHYDIWKPFTAYLLDTLNNYNPGLIYVYMGKKAEEWDILTNDNNHKFFIKHPAAAAYSGFKWDSMDVFNKIAKIVKDNSNQIITW